MNQGLGEFGLILREKEGGATRHAYSISGADVQEMDGS
jgi:hypothetical protein